MTAINSNTTNTSTIPLSVVFTEKSSKFVINVIQGLVKTILVNQSMSSTDFYTKITNDHKVVKFEKSREEVFFKKMLTAVNQQLETWKPITEKHMQVVVEIGEKNSDKNFKEIFIETVTFPIFQGLVNDLDNVNTSIIDDIVQTT